MIRTVRVEIHEREGEGREPAYWVVGGDVIGGIHDSAIDALNRVKRDAERHTQNHDESLATIIEWFPVTTIGRAAVKVIGGTR